MASEDGQTNLGFNMFSRSELDHFHPDIPDFDVRGSSRSEVLQLCVRRYQDYGGVMLPVDPVTGRNLLLEEHLADAIGCAIHRSYHNSLAIIWSVDTGHNFDEFEARVL